MKLTNPDGSETYYELLTCDSASQKISEQQPLSTLLLLHGIGADHRMWQPQMQSYTAAGYQLLVLDLFGHGQSSRLDPIDLRDWHNQINWLLDHCDIKECTLIGVSMGGVIAQSFVVNHPERVKRIVLADTFGELRTSTEKLLGFSQVIGFQLFRLLGKSLLTSTMRSAYQAEYAQSAQAYFGEVSLKANLEQLLLARQAINRIDVLDSLKDVKIPALVIVGADAGQWFVEINQKIANALPKSEFVVLQQAMDPSNLVSPTGFDQQVLRFLQAN